MPKKTATTSLKAVREKDRLLDDDIARSLVRATSLFNRLTRQRVKAEFNITSMQAEILILMAVEPSLLGNDVAAAIGVNPSTVSNALDGMEKCGLVTRQRSTEDRRIVLITLTSLAKRIAGRATKISRGTVSALITGISESDLHIIQRGLKKMADNSRAHTSTALCEEVPQLSRNHDFTRRDLIYRRR